jgi:hypothetical protein
METSTNAAWLDDDTLIVPPLRARVGCDRSCGVVLQV